MSECGCPTNMICPDCSEGHVIHVAGPRGFKAQYLAAMKRVRMRDDALLALARYHKALRMRFIISVPEYEHEELVEEYWASYKALGKFPHVKRMLADV